MYKPVEIDINALPDILTVNEVCALFRVTPLTVKRWSKKGRLPSIRINSRGDRRYKKIVVLAVLNGEEVPHV